MNSSTINRHGLQWGIYIGVVYIALLMARFKLGAGDLKITSLISVGGWIVILVLMLISASQLRKKLGGYAAMKDLFKSLFISIAIFELIFVITQVVYTSYVDPGYPRRMKDATILFMQTDGRNAGMTTADIDKNIELINKQPEHPSFFDAAKSYLMFMGIDGLFALLISFILKREPKKFDNFMEKDELA